MVSQSQPYWHKVVYCILQSSPESAFKDNLELLVKYFEIYLKNANTSVHKMLLGMQGIAFLLL